MFHNLIFNQGKDGKYLIREDIVRKIETIIFGGQTKELKSAAKEGNSFDALPDILDKMMHHPGMYDNYESSLAFLCESSLDVDQLGNVQRFLNKYPDMRGLFKNKGYFSCERLKVFDESLNVFNGKSGEN